MAVVVVAAVGCDEMCQSAAAENALVRSGGCSCCRRLQKAAQKRTLLPSPLHLADQDCLQSVLFSQILLSCNIVRELRRQPGRQREGSTRVNAMG